MPKEAVNGIESFGYDKIKSVASQMYAMCDDKNENVSFDKNRIAELDEKKKQISLTRAIPMFAINALIFIPSSENIFSCSVTILFP